MTATFLYISDEMHPASKQSVGGGEKLVSGRRGSISV